MLIQINDLINRPFALILLAVLVAFFFIKRLDLDFPGFVVAVNNINSQPFALFVLGLGFWMLVECKKFGIDTTIAGGVIGVASNMLQSQIKDAAHPPGSKVVVQSTTETPPVEQSAPSKSVDLSTTAALNTQKGEVGRVFQGIK